MYIIVEAKDIPELIKKVNAKKMEGFTPLGGLVTDQRGTSGADMYYDNGKYYLQAMNKNIR